TLHALYHHLFFKRWSVVIFIIMPPFFCYVILNTLSSCCLGVRGEPFDDSRPNTASTTASMASSDSKSCDQEDEIMSQKITIGVSEILSLLRTLGEGCRLSYMYKCQVRILLLT